MPDNRGRRLKHRSLDWNFKQRFQARTVGGQLQLIVLKNTTVGHSIVLGNTGLKITCKTYTGKVLTKYGTLMEEAQVSAVFCTSSDFSFFPLISV